MFSRNRPGSSLILSRSKHSASGSARSRTTLFSAYCPGYNDCAPDCNDDSSANAARIALISIAVIIYCVSLIYGHRLPFTQRKRRSGSFYVPADLQSAGKVLTDLQSVRTINDEKNSRITNPAVLSRFGLQIRQTINPFREICNLPVYFALALVRVSP